LTLLSLLAVVIIHQMSLMLRGNLASLNVLENRTGLIVIFYSSLFLVLHFVGRFSDEPGLASFPS